jgi:hypothetical protein
MYGEWREDRQSGCASETQSTLRWRTSSNSRSREYQRAIGERLVPSRGSPLVASLRCEKAASIMDLNGEGVRLLTAVRCRTDDDS